MKFSKTKIVLMALATSIILFSLTGCQEQVAAAKRPQSLEKTKMVEHAANASGPRVEFEKVFHNFGKIGPGTRNSCEFNFKNTGDKVLRIRKIESTCSCSIPKLKKRIYEPGESGTIIVNYTPFKNERGKTSRKLIVPTNDKTNPQVTLTIKAFLELKVAHTPTMAKLLLEEENAGCPEIRIKSLDGKPFAIKKIISTADVITVPFVPGIESTEFVLKPKVDIEKLKKNPYGHINIHLTHHEVDLVTTHFKVMPRFSALPESLYVTDAEPAKPTEKEIMIFSNYSEDFEVESVTSKKGYIEVLNQEKIVSENPDHPDHPDHPGYGEHPKDYHYKINLKVTPPPAGENERIFSDMLTVAIKGHEKLEINCRGFYAREDDNEDD